MPQGRPRILVPGKMSKRVLDRLPDRFEPVFVSAADPALVTADMAASVSGIAVQGKIPADFMDALPNLEIIANFGVGYDGVDAEACGKARHRRHQHAGCADRRSGRYGDRPAAQHGAPASGRRAMAAAGPLGQGGRLCPVAADAARPARSVFTASAASAWRSPGGSRASACPSPITPARRARGSPIPTIRR